MCRVSLSLPLSLSLSRSLSLSLSALGDTGYAVFSPTSTGATSVCRKSNNEPRSRSIVLEIEPAKSLHKSDDAWYLSGACDDGEVADMSVLPLMRYEINPALTESPRRHSRM